MKPFRVVCIDDDFCMSKHHGFPHPIKGEIYEVEGIYTEGKDYYFLVGFNRIAPISKKRMVYDHAYFRPVDDSFGEWVEETIKEIRLKRWKLNMKKMKSLWVNLTG